VPVLRLHFGTILTSEDAVAEELLAARHDEFTTALERIDLQLLGPMAATYVDKTPALRALQAGHPRLAAPHSGLPGRLSRHEVRRGRHVA
jgi:hypothetical protein